MRSIARLAVAMGVLFGMAACTGSTGPAGPQGESGPIGPTGPAGATLGTVAGVVSDGFGTLLADVAVNVTDTSGASITSGTTDGAGAFSLAVPAGTVLVSFSKPLYVSPGALMVGVVAARTVDVTATMAEAASARPSVSLTAAGDDVGYATTVALNATASSPLGYPLTYAWSNATAPILGTVSGSGASGSILMPTLAEALAYRPDASNPGRFISGYTLPSRLGVLPIGTDTRGQVTAKVTVSDGHGQSTSATVVVNAASVSPGLRNVPVGTRVYLNSGHDTVNAWTLTAPAGSVAALDDPASRTPSFVADVKGAYTLGEGAATLTVYGGDWKGAISGGNGNDVTPDANCVICHSTGSVALDLFTPWLATGHATMFTRGLNGVLTPYYGASCIGCHTVGYDPGTANAGFDDAAVAAGWTFPSALASSNWSTLVASAPSVGRLANVQCESCHGPQDSSAHMTTDVSAVHRPFVSPRISYAAEVCAPCHAAGDHHIYSEWSTTAAPDASGVAMSHSSRFGATHGAGAAGLNTSCGRCHVAQGFQLYLDALAAGAVAIDANDAAVKVQLADVTPANAEPVTCTACHDPHEATNPNQLRVYGDTANLPSGFAGYGLGKAALCVTCHNSRNGAQTGSLTRTYLHEDGEVYNGGNPTGYSAPHQSAQGDVFLGRNAYFMAGSLPMISAHAAVEDACVGCHMTLQPKQHLAHGAPAASGHLFRIEQADLPVLCANCHGTHVTGEGIQASVEAGLAALASKMGNNAATKINGFPGGLVRVRAWDPATDLYSSTSASNLILDVAANPVTAISLMEIHGQVGLALDFALPITIPFVDASGNPAPSRAMTSFGVQLGALKDNQPTPVPLYALSGNFIRAGWNYFLVEGDQSLGLHNPTFVQSILSASLAKDLSN